MTTDAYLLQSSVKRDGGDGGLLGPQNSIVRDVKGSGSSLGVSSRRWCRYLVEVIENPGLTSRYAHRGAAMGPPLIGANGKGQLYIRVAGYGTS